MAFGGGSNFYWCMCGWFMDDARAEYYCMGIAVAKNQPKQNAAKLILPAQKNEVAIKPAEADTINKQAQQPVIAQQSEQKNTAETAIVKKKTNTIVQKAERDIAKYERNEPVVKHDVIAQNNIVEQRKEPSPEANDIIADLPVLF